jgi:hypothetical protein
MERDKIMFWKSATPKQVIDGKIRSDTSAGKGRFVWNCFEDGLRTVGTNVDIPVKCRECGSDEGYVSVTPTKGK